jgi:hypothetical protein
VHGAMQMLASGFYGHGCLLINEVADDAISVAHCGVGACVDPTVVLGSTY